MADIYNLLIFVYTIKAVLHVAEFRMQDSF